MNDYKMELIKALWEAIRMTENAGELKGIKLNTRTVNEYGRSFNVEYAEIVYKNDMTDPVDITRCSSAQAIRAIVNRLPY